MRGGPEGGGGKEKRKKVRHGQKGGFNRMKRGIEKREG